MALDLAQSLSRLADSLRLHSTILGPVRPGNRVGAAISPVDPTITETVLGDLDLQGTGGLLDQLAGTVPVPAPIPVQLDVEWTVTLAGSFELAEGVGLVSEGGLSGPRISFVLVPTFESPILIVEMTDDTTPPSFPAELRATVKLSIADPGGGTIEEERVLSVPFLAAPIEIPTVLALFRHTNFESGGGKEDGFVLVMVPENSPLKTSAGAINRVFAQLDETLGPLRTVAGLGDFLLGIRVFGAALAAQPHVRMRAVNEIRDLDDIHMIREELLGVDVLNRDTRANDRISSLVLVGPPERAVECFNDENFKTGEGWFSVRLDLGMAAIVRTLHVGDPVSVVGEDLVTVEVRNDDSNRFGDSMSSVRFSTRPLARGDGPIG